MNRLAILMALPLIGACDVQTHDGNKGGADVSLHADDSGQVSFNLAVAQGTLNVPGMKMDEGDFDIDGVRLMPGSSIHGFSIDARDKGATVNVSFKSPASPDATRAYFVDKFKAHGVRAAVSGDRVAGTSKDGDPFTIDVAPAPGGSQGKITVQSKD